MTAATPRSGLYQGRVWHRRYRPKPHALAYQIFMTLIDLDELADLDRTLRLFSRRRLWLMSFRERDHLAGTGDLRRELRAILESHGFEPPGRIRVLCMPRVLGAVFNPLTIYFCESGAGEVSAVLYEVNNTFGERHAYLLRSDGSDVIAHGCEKSFYVSPFNDLDLRYDFRISPPGPTAVGDMSVVIRASDAAGLLLAAAFTGKGSRLTDRAIFSAFARRPLLAATVVLGIHLEALRLWVKGVRLTRKPAPPSTLVTAPGS